MPTVEDFIVPVAPAIREFEQHLYCHPRTILSARYGDGKSYFLDAFMKDNDVRNRFEFIKIYPINYQVLDNRDIFDIIKYDILIQMGQKGMIDDSSDVTSLDAFIYCLKNNGLGLLDNVFNVASSIEGALPVKAIGELGKSCLRLLDTVKQAQLDYKEYKSGNTALLEKYIHGVDQISIYEEDLITKIIRGSIQSWKEKDGNEGKKVVLLIEDMDRIDPAHLFRILNIFSTHMDFAFKYGVNPEDTLDGNKFGFDNIVFVLHYDNLRSIFEHFYGPHTCFAGYVHKFADKGKFEYSLSAEAGKYYYACLSRKTNLNEELLRQILNDSFVCQHTLRDLANSLDKIENQVIHIDGVSYDIASVMASMRRLGMNDSDIVCYLRRVVEDDINLWLKYLYPYLKHFGHIKDETVQLAYNNGEKHKFGFTHKRGYIEVLSYNNIPVGPSLKIDFAIRDILSLVIK